MTEAPVKKKPFRLRLKRKKFKRSLLSEWLIVRTKGGLERYARRNLAQQGFTAIAPFLRNENTRKEEPLFPGYIFVKGPYRFAMKNTFGVLDLVFQGSQPAQMPRREMQALLKQLSKTDDLLVIPEEKLKPGSMVAVIKGPLRNWRAILHSPHGRDRVNLLLNMLGSQRIVTVPAKFVVSASTVEPRAGRSNL